jgi:predicted membrane-bound spermidine synthase
MRALLCVLFFISGASALVFETLWFHQAGLALGNSVWALSLVLAGFMGGIALGNLLAARYGDGRLSPVRAYAALEALIAITGVGLVYVLPELGSLLGPWMEPLLEHPWLLNPLRLAIAFALLLLPSTAMGATLPLLTRVLARSRRDFGRALGTLYGWNTLGAVAGAVGSEMILIGALGVRGTALLTGSFNLAVAAVAVAVSFAMRPPAEPARISRASLTACGGEGRLWLAVAFTSGFALLALEVVWFRFLSLYVSSEALSFAVMLGVVLAGIAVGGLAASRCLSFSPSAHRLAGSIAFASGLACILGYATSPLFLGGQGMTGIQGIMGIIKVGVPLMFPVAFLSGVFFTLAGAALRSRFPSEALTAGALTFANTVGAAAGALAGGFALLPSLGMENSFFLIAVVYGVIGLSLFGQQGAPRILIRAAAAAFALAALAFPFGSMMREHMAVAVARWSTGPNDALLAVREGLTETAFCVEQRVLDRPHSYRLITNELSMTATDIRARRYMKLYVYWALAVQPDVEHALVISYGMGSTAKALTDSRQIESIDVVDISRDVLELSAFVYPEPNENPLDDPRVRVHVEDGRYFLQTTGQRFDLITGEPPPPTTAGVVNLYTREYFQLIYDRLNDGGIATYWLPIHSLGDLSARSIIRSFCDVFPGCSLWNGFGADLMLAGSRNLTGPPTAERFEAQWKDPRVRREMQIVGFETPEQLGALFIGDAPYLNALTRDDLPLVDDFPKRILASSVPVGALPSLYLEWRDVSAARERFRTSALAEKLWPPRMRRDSIPYFETQALINKLGYKENPFGADDTHRGIYVLHELLTKSSLQAPVLWLLRSDGDLQRIANQVDAREVTHAAAQYHLAIGHLARRNYREAALAFGLAEQEESLQRDAFVLRVYALSMDGRTQEARSLAQRWYSDLPCVPDPGEDAPEACTRHRELPLPLFWSWMASTFGVHPSGA